MHPQPDALRLAHACVCGDGFERDRADAVDVCFCAVSHGDACAVQIPRVVGVGWGRRRVAGFLFAGCGGVVRGLGRLRGIIIHGFEKVVDEGARDAGQFAPSACGAPSQELLTVHHDQGQTRGGGVRVHEVAQTGARGD